MTKFQQQAINKQDAPRAATASGPLILGGLHHISNNLGGIYVIELSYALPVL